MSRARSATPAAKRRASRATGSPAPAKRPAAKPKARRATTKTAKPKRAPAKQKAARRAPAKPRTPRRTATGRPAAKGTAATRRSGSRRPPTGRTTGSTRRGWSRPRPLRALGGLVGALTWRARVLICALILIAGAAGYFLWLRDSSLVAVTDVEVVGVASGDRATIIAELTRQAEQQTTLHADPAKIERAAAVFPTVKSVDVDPNFPHGMRIEVTERPPALIVHSGGEEVAAAGDGTVLAGVEVPEDADLPVLEVNGGIPAEGALEGEPLQQALILGAAPEPLRPLIHSVRFDDDYGVETILRGGIPIRFGSGSAAAEKWAAAAAVLASPKVDALTYADVRVPERPTVGGNG